MKALRSGWPKVGKLIFWVVVVSVQPVWAQTELTGGESPAIPPGRWEYQLAVNKELGSATQFSVVQVLSQEEEDGLIWSAVHFVVDHRVADSLMFGWALDGTIDIERGTTKSGGTVVKTQTSLSRAFGSIDCCVSPLFEISRADEVTSAAWGIDGMLSKSVTQSILLELESHWKCDLSAASAADLFLVPKVGLTSGSVTYSAGIALGRAPDSDEAELTFYLDVAL